MNRRKIIFILIFIIPTAIIAIYSISVSLFPFSFSEAMDVIVKHLEGFQTSTYDEFLLDQLIFNGTLPRAISGILVGGILAVGGAVMQSVIRNPLADSYTTGISSGALFGVTIFIILDISVTSITGYMGQIINAFIFSLIPCAVIMVFSIKRNTTPTMMILIGIAVMYLFTAATTMLKYTADPDDINMLYEWSIGSLAKAGWDGVPFLLLGFLGILISSMFLSNKIDVLSSGDNIATSMGVKPVRIRMIVMFIVSICTATAVCFTGSIGFVGLVIPHVARMFVGSKTKYLVPCSAILGALLLVSADSIARMLGGTGLPVGVLTALIGSPIFLYFLIKIKKGAWGS